MQRVIVIISQVKTLIMISKPGGCISMFATKISQRTHVQTVKLAQSLHKVKDNNVIAVK